MASRIYYTELLTYSEYPAELDDVEPSLEWSAVPLPGTAGSKDVYVAVYDAPSTAQTVIVGARSDTNRCYFALDTGGGVSQGRFYTIEVNAGDPCPEPLPGDVTASSW